MELLFQGLIDIAKMLSFRLQQRLDPFAMLSVEGTPETQLFRHLSNHIIRSRYFLKYSSYEGHHLLANL